MSNEKYINNITLEYLLNPILYDKINCQDHNSDQLILDDILFYRRRICKYTKDMCKGNYINNNFKKLFLNYATAIVYYLKQLDEKDIIQSDYNDLNLTPSQTLNTNDPQTLNTNDPQTLKKFDQINIDNIIINKIIL